MKMAEIRSFVDLMALSSARGIGDKYISQVPAFNPGSGAAFGGHVFAQAVWAASQTVDEEMVVHVGSNSNDYSNSSSSFVEEYFSRTPGL